MSSRKEAESIDKRNAAVMDLDMTETEIVARLRSLADLQHPERLGLEKNRAWRIACRMAADLLASRAGPNRAENEIRADECRQIMYALDHYGPASDYGPPITERIALHERGATNRHTEEG